MPNWTTASGASANAWVYAGQDKSSLNDLDGKTIFKVLGLVCKQL